MNNAKDFGVTFREEMFGLDGVADLDNLNSKYGKITVGFTLNMADRYFSDDVDGDARYSMIFQAVMMMAFELEKRGLNIKECLDMARDDLKIRCNNKYISPSDLMKMEASKCS